MSHTVDAKIKFPLTKAGKKLNNSYYNSSNSK